MEIPRVAVVATYNRPAELRRLLDAIAPQCDFVIVVDNASTPPVDVLDPAFGRATHLRVIRDEEQPPNLSRLWNVGLDAARDWVWAAQANGAIDPREPLAWDVAVLNDDAVPPPGWWNAVSRSMRMHGAAAASACPFDSLPPGGSTVWFGDAPYSVTTRLAGWAFMLRGEDGLRLDERLRWWFGDDQLSAQARRRGGLVHVGGVPVPNTGANTSTVGVLAEQAGRDRDMFVHIEGRQPW